MFGSTGFIELKDLFGLGIECGARRYGLRVFVRDENLRVYLLRENIREFIVYTYAVLSCVFVKSLNSYMLSVYIKKTLQMDFAHSKAC